MAEQDFNLPFSIETLHQRLQQANKVVPLLPAEQYAQGSSTFEDRLVAMVSREPYLAEHGYVLLSKECLEALVGLLRGKTVVDVGSGGGFLSYCLSNAGVDVTAVEAHPPSDVPTEADPRRLWKVDHAGCAIEFPIANYDAVILSWPVQDSPFAAKIAGKVRPGQILIYQGEYYGCTAGHDFFEMVETPGWSVLVDDTKSLNEHHVQFPCIRDRWTVFRKN